MKCRIYRIDKDNPLPAYANCGDAGVDCYAREDVFFDCDQTKLIPTGIIAEAPEGYHWKLFLRSSMASKRGFILANGVGIIDKSFCGPNDEIKVLLRAPRSGYSSISELCQDGSYRIGYKIKKGERIAQLILEKNIEIEWDEQDDINFKGQSRGGFGSSGA